MPRGRPRKSWLHLTWRIPPDVLDAIVAATRRANYHANRRTRAEAYTVRTWINKAITEKLDHLERRRRQNARNTARRRAARAALRAEVVVSDGVTKNPGNCEPPAEAA